MNTMTSISNAITPANTPVSIEDLDLTPDGLSDAPAHQQDVDSIVQLAESD